MTSNSFEKHFLEFHFIQFVLLVFAVRFNKHPKKGVKYLQENGLLGLEASDVAEFLQTDERLDKVSLHYG